jgi:2-polyprenyl-3-methyl-5-hydroxy-6-metoxy-1,4-benzoquinol methylase
VTTHSSDPAKPEAYFATPRIDLLTLLVDRPFSNVLDVGCGAGANGPWLRQHGAQHIEGVEPDGPSADLAAGQFDVVYRSTIEDAITHLDGPYDLVICADVLEHLVDPRATLANLREAASPRGVLLVSVPNIRYVGAMLRIAFGAGFRPEVAGTFDSTHLRFFTRRNLRDALEAAGWCAETWAFPRSTPVGYLRSLLGWLTRGLSDEWLAAEWYVVARPAVVGPT